MCLLLVEQYRGALAERGVDLLPLGQVVEHFRRGRLRRRRCHRQVLPVSVLIRQDVLHAAHDRLLGALLLFSAARSLLCRLGLVLAKKPLLLVDPLSYLLHPSLRDQRLFLVQDEIASTERFLLQLLPPQPLHHLHGELGVGICQLEVLLEDLLVLLGLRGLSLEALRLQLLEPLEGAVVWQDLGLKRSRLIHVQWASVRPEGLWQVLCALVSRMLVREGPWIGKGVQVGARRSGGWAEATRGIRSQR